MRTIDKIVIHCTAGSQKQTPQQLRQYFRNLGWKNPGYHYVIDANGTLWTMLPEDEIANGARGHNAHSIHIAWIGGLDLKTGKAIDNRTPAQKQRLKSFVKAVHRNHPSAIVVGHRDLSPDLNGDGIISKNEWMKECPCFDVRKELFDV